MYCPVLPAFRNYSTFPKTKKTLRLQRALFWFLFLNFLSLLFLHYSFTTLDDDDNDVIIYIFYRRGESEMYVRRKIIKEKKSMKTKETT